jgi:threonine/homoserine/homoserine lactone efflux protein
MHPVLAGIVVSLSNPYWTIWWATIGLGYVIMGLKFGAAGIAVFFLGHICSDFAWYSFVSYGVAGGKRLLSEKVYQGIIAACGVALLLFGVWFFHAGLAALRGG